MKKVTNTLLLVFITVISFSQSKEIDSLRLVLATTKSDTARVLALIRLSYNSYNVDTCFIMDAEALSLARKINFPRGEAAALVQYVNDFLSVDNFPKALEYSLQSLKINERINNTAGLATDYSQMGRIYKAQGNYKKAIEYMHKAIDVAAKIKPEALKLDYFILGQIYEAEDKLDSALASYQRSFELYSRDTKDQNVLDLLSSLGDIHRKLGHIEIAKAFYRTGIDKYIPGTASLEFGKNYYGLALIFKQDKQIDSSIYYAKKAFDKATSNPEMTARSALLLSELYEPNDPGQSFYYYKLATTTRDSVYEAGKLLQLNNMLYNEELRQKEIAEEELKAKLERRHNLQYAAIAMGLVTFIILFLLFSQTIIANQKLIRFLGLIALLIVFEFINLLIHPLIARLTHHSPLMMLLIMVAIAALLVPAHHHMEEWISKKLVEKNKRIRLAAAKKTMATLGDESGN